MSFRLTRRSLCLALGASALLVKRPALASSHNTAAIAALELQLLELKTALAAEQIDVSNPAHPYDGAYSGEIRLGGSQRATKNITGPITVIVEQSQVRSEANARVSIRGTVDADGEFDGVIEANANTYSQGPVDLDMTFEDNTAEGVFVVNKYSGFTRYYVNVARQDATGDSAKIQAYEIQIEALEAQLEALRAE